MEHFSHEHPLILNEIYIAKEGDVCRCCKEEIVSCRSFVYSCSGSSTSSPNSTRSTDHDKCGKFLLHKSCAELPPTIKHPDDHDVSLYLSSSPDDFFRCIVCGFDLKLWSGFFYASSEENVCARCALASLEEDRIYRQHPAHPQHTLNFFQHLSSFKCDACKVVDDNIRDLSYICTKCRFCIHKSCADAPASFQFQFHDKHPLKLSFSLPELYQMFDQYCRFCTKRLRHTAEWLYYCPKCRFFAHFHCARSNRMMSLIEDAIYDSNAVHLPAADETSADQLAEQFVMAMSTKITTNRFRHWDHVDHGLQLMTINELNDKKHDDEILILCNACVKPIRTDHHENHFYGCVSCNYFMHKACAGLPREIEHRLRPPTIMQTFTCDGCRVVTTGIACKGGGYRFHIGCLTLPQKIKHEAHSHQLKQVFREKHVCKACGYASINVILKYGCAKCNFYVCAACIMKPRTVKHRWDTHPLSLIYDPSMVDSDHEQEFNCEFCSEEINTNFWFYHCSDCDLSFHIKDCFERSVCREYSNIKFGAVIYAPALHQDHSLTLVLNKKFRTCERCQSLQIGEPVLECAPCKVIFCKECAADLAQKNADDLAQIKKKKDIADALRARGKQEKHFMLIRQRGPTRQ